MKKLILLLIVLSVVLMGCNSVCPVCPEEELIVEEPALDCNGHYMVVYDDFQMGDWVDCDYFAPAGIYWRNYDDGRIFFLAETGVVEVENEACENGIGYENIPDPLEIFGDCPNGYEWELIIE